jgi:hypothetical protein
MFITATEVTVWTDISVTAATITAGGYIEIAEERLNHITNNWFTTDIEVQAGCTFAATARTITVEGAALESTYGFADSDIIYVYNSYRNDGYYEVLTVTNSVFTCVTGSTVVSELSGQSIYISRVDFPNALKHTLAQMIKYDVDDRKKQIAGVKSRTLGPWSETYNGDSGRSVQGYGYPSAILDQLAPWTIIRSY